MRRFFTIVAAMSLAITVLYAQEPNIYASGLSANTVDNTNQEVQISYTLNAPASSLAIILQNETNPPYEIQITESEALTKGTHTNIAVSLSTIPTGNYTWKLKAVGKETVSEPTLIDNTTGILTTPRGVAINNNFESPYFGHMYVTDSKNKTTDGGIYVFDAAFTDITNQGENAWSKNFSNSPASPLRLTIAPDDKIYITDWSDNETSGVHVWDPATPTTDAISVFGGTVTGGNAKEGDIFIHGSVSHCYVIGTGTDTKLYTYDEDLPQKINLYEIGDLETPWVNAPTPITYPENIANGNGMIFPDNKGGWWIAQHRATDPIDGTYPGLIHMNSSGEADYSSMGALGSNTRGVVGLNMDQSLVATAGTISEKNTQGQILIFDVTWDNNNIPTLSSKYTINTPFTNTCYTVVFDVAGNVYATGDNHILGGWALPKAENSFTTPAPSTSMLEITNAVGIHTKTNGKVVESVSYNTPTGITVPANAKGLLLKKTTYTDGSTKVEKIINK